MEIAFELLVIPARDDTFQNTVLLCFIHNDLSTCDPSKVSAISCKTCTQLAFIVVSVLLCSGVSVALLLVVS